MDSCYKYCTTKILKTIAEPTQAPSWLGLRKKVQITLKNALIMDIYYYMY